MSQRLQRFYKNMFLVAAWHNFIGGAIIIFFYSKIYTYYGLAVPTVHYQEWVGLIFVFGIAALLIARNMFGNKNVILICILGKLVSVAPMIYGLIVLPATTPGIFIIPAITDGTIGLVFLVFYVHASRAKLWK